MDIFSDFFGLFQGPIFIRTLIYFYDLMPIWAPIILGAIALRLWLTYIKTAYIVEQGSVLLEIKLPPDARRSPKGMELLFIALYQTGSATEFDTYWGGKIRPWFSLELFSDGGEIHFYIWSHAKWRNIIEAQLYAQYPGIEIYEAEDYTKGAYWDPVEYPMWGTNFVKSQNTVYPLTTYIDYGLDRDDEPEFKVDPMSSVLEYLGSLKKGEQLWMQIIIQAHKKEVFKDGRLMEKSDWRDAIKKEIKKIREDASKNLGKENLGGFVMLTKGEQDTIASLERSMSKYPFETYIRAIYYPKKDVFTGSNINGLIGSFRQYSSRTGNNLAINTFYTDFDYPWQDFMRLRRNMRERSFLKAYKMRSAFHSPYKNYINSPFIMNTEELATVFHIPSLAVMTPGLPRVSAKKSEAPANLPV